MGRNHLQNDVPEPAYPFSSSIPEGGWVSSLMSVLWRWEKSWIFVLTSLQEHLLSSFDGVEPIPPILGALFPHKQPYPSCGKNAGGWSSVLF